MTGYPGVNPARARSHSTFTTIRSRLDDVGIALERFIASELIVYPSLLDGLSFRMAVPQSPLAGVDFLTALRVATVTGKRPAFREGKKLDMPHWAVDASMGATTGIGFREIVYLDLKLPRGPVVKDLSMRRDAPQPSAVFSAAFGNSRGSLDITSLHCAVWGDFCSVHIDQTGFVIGPTPGFGDDVIVTPDFLMHTLLELIWKDKLRTPDGIDIVVPNSRNDFSSVGLTATGPLTDRVSLSVTQSYQVRGERGITATVVLSGTF